MIKREDVLSCLPSIGREFSNRELISALEQKCEYGENDKTTLYRILKNLESENFIDKIDSTHYKVVDVQRVLTSAKFLIKECEKLQKIYEWNFGEGWFSHARTEGMILGVDEKLDLQDWQREIYHVLMTRMATTFDALRELLTTKSKMPEEEALYIREYVLEILPYLLGHKGHGGSGYATNELSSILNYMASFLKKKNYIGIDDMEELEQSLTKINNWKNNPAKWRHRKKNQKFGMVFLPDPHLLDPGISIERKILELLQDCIKEKQSAEKISATLFSHFDVPEVEKVLQKYSGYYDSPLLSEIIKICNKIEIGFQVIFCLYDIDYCLKVIDGFENHGLKVGYYDTDGYYCGRSNPFFIGFGNGGFFVNSDSPIGANRLFNGEHWLKPKSFYEDILAKTSEKIDEIFHEIGIDKSLRFAMFSSGILLAQSPRFNPDDIDLFEVLKYQGNSPDKNQIKEWIELGKHDAIDLVKKWVGPRNNYDYLFSSRPITHRDPREEIYYEDLEFVPISDDDVDRNMVYKEVTLKGTEGIFTINVPKYSGSLPVLYNDEFAVLQKAIREIEWKIEVESGLIMRIGNKWFRPTKTRNYDNTLMKIPVI